MPIDETVWETALLDGGPADGVRVRVAGRPDVIQVTRPCEVEPPHGHVRAAAFYVYRRSGHEPEGLRYGFDPASP
ncbi:MULTISPECIES: hypothetical protein [unclassified Streptomyces]|uniref:hypothetical protein n=1 Tax=unclassified Streptomyces TaxID=2593676 RepID=UPI0021CC6FA9|nr:hypothetical protein [Streptomyces sp. sk2.1]